MRRPHPLARDLLAPALLCAACLPGNPGTSEDASTGAQTTTEATGGAGQGLIGCSEGHTCQLVLVAQTLDDRIEIFSAEDPENAVYRGAIDVDLKQNGRQDGDYSGERLDEPFGLALQGGFLHVIVGHYPSRAEGTLLSFPETWFGQHSLGATVPSESIFDGTVFAAPIVERPLAALEPIFVLPHGSGRLLVSAFANDLFAAEDAWTSASELLIVDAANPSQAPGRVSLAALEGGLCAGAAQTIEVAEGVIAVACDGNEAVAFLDASGLGTDTPAAEAQAMKGRLCSLPPTPGHRVRYLAPDGNGGVVVAVGPGADITAGSDLYRIDTNCNVLGLTPLEGQGLLGPIVQLSGNRWVFARAAGPLPQGARGLYVATDGGGAQLEVCGPIGGMAAAWQGEQAALDPLALALAPDGRHLAVGVAPWQVAAAGDPGFGRVLWVDVPSDPCGEDATFIDLTGSEHAPAVDPFDVETWRRAPTSITVVEVAG